MMRDFLASPMFMYSNIILVMLAIGAAVNLIFQFIKSRDLKALAVNFWLEEKYLFGIQGKAERDNAGKRLFLFAAVLLQFNAFFLNSLIRKSFPQFIHCAAMLAMHAYLIFLVVKILFATKYSGRQLLVVEISFFILRWTYYNNHNFWLMTGILFAFAAKDIDFRKTLRACLVTGAVCMAATAMLTIADIIPSGNFMDEKRIRYAFGYGWPNLTGAYLLALDIMYICFRGAKNFKWFDYSVCFILLAICKLGPDSRSATVSMLILLIAVIVVKWFPAIMNSCIVRSVACALVPVLCVGSWWAHWAYTPENALLYKINQILTKRLEFGHNALINMPFKIAGQMPGEDIIDNVYLFTLLTSGPVAAFLIFAAFTVLIWKLLKSGHITELVCTMTFLIHGTMEHHVFWPCVNVTLWLIAGVIYLISAKEFYSFSKEKELLN